MKTETLEEATERILANNIDGLKEALEDDDLFYFYKGVIQCYGEAMTKWQQERSYSEKQTIDFAEYCVSFLYESFATGKDIEVDTIEELFEQFKKPIEIQETEEIKNLIGNSLIKKSKTDSILEKNESQAKEVQAIHEELAMLQTTIIKTIVKRGVVVETDLQKTKEHLSIAITTLETALSFIIPYNLRKRIETTLSEIK